MDCPIWTNDSDSCEEERGVCILDDSRAAGNDGAGIWQGHEEKNVLKIREHEVKVFIEGKIF